MFCCLSVTVVDDLKGENIACALLVHDPVVQDSEICCSCHTNPPGNGNKAAVPSMLRPNLHQTVEGGIRFCNLILKLQDWQQNILYLNTHSLAVITFCLLTICSRPSDKSSTEPTWHYLAQRNSDKTLAPQTNEWNQCVLRSRKVLFIVSQQADKFDLTEERLNHLLEQIINVSKLLVLLYQRCELVALWEALWMTTSEGEERGRETESKVYKFLILGQSVSAKTHSRFVLKSVSTGQGPSLTVA